MIWSSNAHAPRKAASLTLALNAAVVIGKPTTEPVRALNALYDNTSIGRTSRISLPACGLQSIRITCCLSGTHAMDALALGFAGGLTTGFTAAVPAVDTPMRAVAAYCEAVVDRCTPCRVDLPFYLNLNNKKSEPKRGQLLFQ